jgi:DNA invertase Pin-like site-specific DNA recombinase
MKTLSSTAPRAALYARVSTRDKGQNPDNQLGELRDYAARMGWRIEKQYVDSETGSTNQRPELDAMMKAAAKRDFDLVVVFDLSRLTRTGPAGAFELIARLKASGVEFWSMNEEHFRTSGPAGELFIAIAAYLAKAERASMETRIRAGIARARREGKRFGRPPSVVINLDRMHELQTQGLSIRAIARKLKTSPTTIARKLSG